MKRSSVALAVSLPLALALLFCAVSSAMAQEQTIKITAKKFEFTPSEITLKKGVPVVLELTSLDRLHGFNCPGLKIRADVEQGKTATVKFTPDTAGEFPFHCDIFCGSGHEMMHGKFVVSP